MMDRRRLGLREVRSLEPGAIAWDSTVVGFGARRQREVVSYVLKYRTLAGRQRWLTIGRHGAPWTPDTARAEARRVLGEVAKGADPAADKQAGRRAIRIDELCRRYMADAEAGRIIVRGGKAKKQSTIDSDKGRVDGHIVPLLGHIAVSALTKNDVEKFMHDVAAGITSKTQKTKPRGLSQVRGGRGVATRTIGLLGAIMTYAVDQRLRPDNPVQRVRKFAENRRDRRMSDAEYMALGNACRAAREAAIWPSAIQATRFLALTGWRSGEALGLRWRDVDLVKRTATLPDTKTGRSIRPLSKAACDLLRGLDRTGDLAFPPTRGTGTMTGFKGFFRRIAALGELPDDVTPHTLRHSFASLAGDLAFSEPTIAALIGHKSASVTGRYMHAADSVLLTAADAVADETVRRMGDEKPTASVVEMRRLVAG